MNQPNHHLETMVRYILLHDWDPIGVVGIAEAEDEYDLYVTEICKMLQVKRSFSDIYEHLRRIEVERLGLGGDELHTQTIAKKLMTLAT
jgi:hypothetical protein